MRVLAALALVAATAVACGGGLFRQYEYEEDMYLSLDGSATLYVNTSLAALDALRGSSFDTNPDAKVDRQGLTDYFSSPVTHVTRITNWRRNNRRFVQVRLDVDDVTRLSEAKPFAWSAYRFKRDGASDLFLYLQTIGASAHKDVGNVGWTGRELVAFRLHIPSKVEYHNAGVENFKRGNILVWERPLEERLRGTPLIIDARMHTQSILYTALWLFGGTFIAVAIMFTVVILWILRRGRNT